MPKTATHDSWFDRPQLSDKSEVSDPVLRSRSRRVLLDCLSSVQSFEVNQADLDDISGVIEWKWIIDRAAAHKVAGLLAHHLAVFNNRELPAESRKRLDEYRTLYAKQSQKCIRTLEVVSNYLDEQSVDFLLLKGQILSQDVYRNPRARPSSDLDLLIRPEDIPRAETCLTDLGFSIGQKDGLSGVAYRDNRIANHFHFSYCPPVGQVEVELHWKLTHSDQLRLSTSQLWSDTRIVQLGSTCVRSLGIESMLLHLCLHASHRGPHGVRLLHLCDVDWYLNRHRHEINWPRTLEKAKAWGIAPSVAGTLFICQSLFGSENYQDTVFHCGAIRRFALRFAANSEPVVDQRIQKLPIIRRLVILIQRAGWDLGLRRRPRQTLDELHQGVRRLRIILCHPLKQLTTRRQRL